MISQTQFQIAPMSSRSRIIGSLLLALLLLIAGYHIYLPYGIDNAIRNTSRQIVEEVPAADTLSIGDVNTDLWNGDISVKRIVVTVAAGERLHIGKLQWKRTYLDLVTLPWRDPLADRDSVKLDAEGVEWGTTDRGIDLEIGRATLQLSRHSGPGEPLRYQLSIDSHTLNVSPSFTDRMKLPFFLGSPLGDVDEVQLQVQAGQNELRLPKLVLRSPQLTFRAHGDLKPLMSDRYPPRLKLEFNLKADSLPVEWPIYPKLGSIAASGLEWHGTLTDSMNAHHLPSLRWSRVDHHLNLFNPVWYPPAGMLNPYEALMQAANISTEAIKGKSLNIHYNFNPRDSLLHLDPVHLQSEPFDLELVAHTKIKQPHPPDGPIRAARLIIQPNTKRLEQALQLLEKWVQPPWEIHNSRRIIRIRGTLSHPYLVLPSSQSR